MRLPTRYAIVIENAGSNYSAYVPDLPGCVATGATIEETERSVREAIEFQLEGMRKDGTPIPAAFESCRLGRGRRAADCPLTAKARVSHALLFCP